MTQIKFLTQNEIDVLLSCIDKYYFENENARGEGAEYNQVLGKAYNKLAREERRLNESN